MLSRLRSTFFAWTAAVVLALSVSGLVAAANLVGDSPATDEGASPPAATDTSVTFVDLNGDGIDDHCQTDVVADQTAADAALTAADTDGDGTISVSEAAHTSWTGGPNCNHGGYVSGVAGASGDDQNDGAATDPAELSTDQNEPPKPVCDAAPPVAPTTTSVDQAPTDTLPNAHGLAVSAVAQSNAVGGKNCNHGGAVSAAAKKDHGADVHGNAGKQHGASGKQHGKGHGKGHANP